MSRSRPGAGCFDLPFRESYPITEPAEVALEDYARVLIQAQAAEGIRAGDDPALVTGVHVCGLGASPTKAIMTDLEHFARDLVTGGNGGGLGWS